MSVKDEDSYSDDETRVVIPINHDYSDGDASTWPVGSGYDFADDSNLREKLARFWLQKTGAYEEGVDYMIDQLPEGYALIERPRYSNPYAYDRFIWGHPYGNKFTSSVSFFPHFYWLMTGGADGCTCANCVKQPKQHKHNKKSKLNATSKARPRQTGQRSIQRIMDAEGNPDVFKSAIKKLRVRGSLDEPITERGSMDWRAERTLLQRLLAQMNLQASFIPRPGEIVLWVPSLDGELAWNTDVNRVQILSLDGSWLGDPEWRAGVVGQIPEEDVVLKDISEATRKVWAVNYSGFRVETFPDPNSYDKSLSLHYKYVPLKCIKPFNAYELFCQGLRTLHPSIQNALTVMSSFSLLDKYHFKGTWPNASIYSNAIFLGAELLVVGDAVKLKPRGYRADRSTIPTPIDVMVIDKIRLDLTECNDDIKSGQLAQNYAVRIEGKVYTNHRSRGYAADGMHDPHGPRSLAHEEVVNAFQYVGMEGYGPWYRTHAPDASVEVSQDVIIGRCYEPDSMHLLFGCLSLSLDLHGVLRAREYSRQNDERLPEGKHWFWGDYRTETLALHTLNGEDVSHYSEGRDLNMWRAALRIIDGSASLADMRAAKINIDRKRPRPGVSKDQSGFAAVGKTSTLVRTGLGTTDVSNQCSSADDMNDFDGSFSASVSDNEIANFSNRLTIARGGTEETSLGDYVPDDDDDDGDVKRHRSKRPKTRK